MSTRLIFSLVLGGKHHTSLPTLLYLLFFSGLLLPSVSLAANKTVYGLNEYASLIEIDVEIAAKLDTGAKTASLSARDIKHFKRNGESWVRFYIASDSKHIHPIERPLARVSKIKRRADDVDPNEENKYSSRPVINLDICMGEALRTIEVNLTDRSAFQYPLLIGSEALKRFDALVDPSLKYAAGKPGCASVAQNAE
ncbi:ATP-dependent zinc protease [Pseudomonas amygdali pv. morsprunorum]|nr:ATP-dependent zinc protease [Pseudomonas amygdali pv. morsprunorum]